ncbi:hypothetical protein GCM10012287_50160 [Streptomyces daqingensis]|uniref:Uncharacterized protein n=1 Tax=Streptomyces daqingensis TaxID=1472640 RepID=A0ABQ2MS64_9ACTN|nr:hypothetical protein [Streptomyces daqingensis]GGO56479.1 hypothetical protein GCM10012287_50160 [Streptomyces daqingensis]
MNDKAEQAAQEARGQVETALAGVDQPVVFGPSQGTGRAKTPPRRRWPDPSVVRKPEKGLLDRLFLFVVVPVHHLTDPIGNFFDWLLDTVTFRRKRRALHGGWGSTAGSLLAAHHTSARRFLVVGRTGLHLVYLGELGSETGWSLPREQVRGVEHLEWAGGMPRKATLRFHFTDGSWGDVAVVGQTWQQMQSQFPAAAGK